MNDLSIFPADIAEMSTSQLASLPTQQLYEVDTNLDHAIAWLKSARTKVDAALDQRFGAQGREALRDTGRDFGTAHLKSDGLHVKFELPKKVSWDQKKLKAIAERIVASGEVVESYLDVKLTVSDEPLFPRYLFIRLGQGDSAPSWAPIRSTKGVSRLVSFGVEPAKVADSLVEALRAQEATVHAEPERLFKPGERVRLTEAPFAGIEGIYQMADGERRVMVLIELLSKQVRVRVAPANLRKVG